MKVAQGDTVKKGDVLMTFDTTLSDLQLERKRLEVEKLKLDLETAQKKLKDIRNMKPMSIVSPDDFDNSDEDSDDEGDLKKDYELSYDHAYDGSESGKALICWLRLTTNANGDRVTPTVDDALLEEARQRAEVLELLRVVGLEDVKDELATSLPYGKQRRLEIARALATDPTLLLLDEPAAGMNPQETLELASFIREIRDHFQKTILLIEHHMDLVMGIADRIYVLDFGKLIAQGTPEEIQNNERVIDAYLGVADDAED